jgi:ligand-binding SRPBCC domain-containing protein
MSRLYSLKSIQRIPADRKKVWDFFSDASNLQLLTPPFLQLRPTNQPLKKEVYAGQVITYTVKPLLGIPFSWMTEIRHVDHEKMFVDEQRKGPYKLWHHQHHFEEIEGGVLMTDLVHYRLPGWIFGNLANSLIVKNKLQEIFSYRFNKINELFGAWPGEKIELEFQ